MRKQRNNVGTRLIRRQKPGIHRAYPVSRAVASVYDELGGLAASYLRRNSGSSTMEPADLVHDAYARLAGRRAPLKVKNRMHLRALAAQAMRWVLADHYRQRLAAKRGGSGDAKWERITMHDLSEKHDRGHEHHIDALSLEEVLRKLRLRNERASQIVKLRYLAGMTIKDTAQIMGLSVGTIKNEWRWARAFLHKELTGEFPPDHADA